VKRREAEIYRNEADGNNQGVDCSEKVSSRRENMFAARSRA